jgi:hypothetical protein
MLVQRAAVRFIYQDWQSAAWTRSLCDGFEVGVRWLREPQG